MRARHRHFNPKAAGAATALDARFTSFANNAAVDTWASRTGSNDVAQATAANRPTFIASAIASQGAIRFDGANSPNQDFLQNTSFVVAQPFFVLSATKFNTKRAAFLCDATSNTSRVSMGLNATGNAAEDGELYIFAGTNAPAENVDIRGSWNVVCGLFHGSNSKLYRNGSEVASGNAGANNFATLKIGERVSNVSNITQHDGDIANFVVFSGTNASLRKRLEHAAAFSWKISCN